MKDLKINECLNCKFCAGCEFESKRTRDIDVTKSLFYNDEIDKESAERSLRCGFYEHEDIESFTDEYDFLANDYRTTFIYENYAFDTVDRAFEYAKNNYVPEDNLEFDDVKITIMSEILKAKFDQNNDLKELLLATGDSELINNTKEDKFFGVVNGEGENYLGFLLTKLRNMYRLENN